MLIDPTVPLTLAETLGSVLSSIVEAQQQAARATVEFISDVGFGPGGPPANRRLLTTTFGFTKLDENRQPAPFEIEIPLLALVDIPLIVVRKATIALSYNVTESAPPEEAPATQPAQGSSLFNIAKPAILRGQIVKRSAAPVTATSAESQREQSASIDITVEVEKAGPPVGIDRLIDLLEVALAERPAPNGG